MMSRSFDDLLDEVAEPKTLDKSIKQMAGSVAKNLTTIGSLVVVFAFVCIFLFDLELNTKVTLGLAADAVVSAILFQFFRTFQGEDGRKSGKADKDYIDSKKRYEEKLQDVPRIGTEHMQAFCDAYAADNLKARRVKVLHPVRVDYATYQAKYIDADKRTVMKDKSLTRKQRAAIVTANSMHAALLTPDMLVLGDFGAELNSAILTPPSVKDRRQVKGGIAVTVAMATFSSAIAFGATAAPTLAKAVYCALKLCFMLFQGIKERYQKHLLYSVDAVKYNDWLTSMIDRYAAFARTENERAKVRSNEKSEICRDDISRDAVDQRCGESDRDATGHHDAPLSVEHVPVRNLPGGACQPARVQTAEVSAG